MIREIFKTALAFGLGHYILSFGFEKAVLILLAGILVQISELPRSEPPEL